MKKQNPPRPPQNEPAKKPTLEQMVDGIAGKQKPDASPQEQELRRRLAGRAAEALMFMDDDV